MATIKRNQYFIDEVLLEKSVENNISCEINLPDYCPDITSVLQCFAMTNISSSSFTSSVINVSGNVLLRVLYLNAGEIFSYEYVQPFEAVIDHECDCVGAVLEVGTFSQYINCRALSARRLEVKGSFIIQAKLSECMEKSVADAIELDDVQLNKDTISACSAGGKNMSVIALAQVLDIGPDKPEMKSIIRNIAYPIVEQTKLVTGKILVKGELRVKTLYKSEENTVEYIENALPLSQILELEGVNEESTVNLNLTLDSLEVQMKTSALGAMSLLDIKADVRLVACCYNCIDFPVIKDAFSTKYESDCTFENVCVDRIVKSIHEQHLHTFEIEKTQDVKRVIDIWFDNVHIKAHYDNPQIVFNTQFDVFVLYENESGELAIKNSSQSFSIKEDMEGLEQLKCEPTVKITGNDYRIKENVLEIRLNMDLDAVVLDRMCKKVVQDIRLGEPAAVQKSALVLVYAKKGESLWTIARTYHTSVQEIMEQNQIDTPSLIEDKKLILWS